MTTATNNQPLQGPMHSVDVIALLAAEDRRSRDDAMSWGMHANPAYYRAWLWLNYKTNPRFDFPGDRPTLDCAARWAIQRVQGAGMAPLRHRLNPHR